MEGDGRVGYIKPGPDHLGQLLAALREIEDNIVFKAWCISRGRDVKRRFWRHPAFLPLVLLGLVFILVSIFSAQTMSSQYWRMDSFTFAGLLCVIWVIPLIFGGVYDALRMMGGVRVRAHWDTFVAQLKGTTVSDHEFLVAAFRVCWPRLLLAAVGSGVVFWVLALWPYIWLGMDNSSKHANLMIYGTAMTAQLIFSGALGGIGVVLAGLALGRDTASPGWIITSAVTYCMVTLGVAHFSLESYIYDVDFGLGNANRLTNPPWICNPCELFEPQWIIKLVIPLTLLVLVLSWALLKLASRRPVLRMFLLAGWWVLLPLIALCLHSLYQWIAIVGYYSYAANQIVDFRIPIWIASLFCPLNTGLNPSGINLSWPGFYMEYPRQDYDDVWLRYLVLCMFQLSFIAVLYRFALDSIHRWRRGEE